MKLLLYCTKAKPYLYFEKDLGEDEYGMIYEPQWLLTTDSCFDKNYAVNGKIVAECDFEVSEIELHQAYYNYGAAYFTERKEPFRYFSYTDLLEASCLQDNKIRKYLGYKGGKAIHIKNLHIFDEPRELKELLKITSEIGFSTIFCDYCSLKTKCIDCLDYYYTTRLDKAPQNMMYVFDGEEKKVLISIHPEWLCKILNGEKTIEVRKKVLKEIIKNA